MVQYRGLSAMLLGADVFVLARSGTGKTTAMAIALLQRASPYDCAPHETEKMGSTPCVENPASPPLRGLVLTTTRELACGTASLIQGIGEPLFSGKKFCVEVHGGVTAQRRKDSSSASIAVATMGGSRAMDISGVTLFCIDEVDEMLHRGAHHIIQQTFSRLPHTQICLFSSSLPLEVQRLSQSLQPSALRIIVRDENRAEALHNIRHFFVGIPTATPEGDKVEVLCDLLTTLSEVRSVVYCCSSRKAGWLAKQLETVGVSVTVLYPDHTAVEREAVMGEFRGSAAGCLIAADPVACGGAPVVFHYDAPYGGAGYLARVGVGRRRSGCGGVPKLAITLSEDAGVLDELRVHHSIHVEELPMDFASCLE